MNFSTIEVIILFVVIQLLFFVVLLWLRNVKNKKSNAILSLFFLALAINITNFLILLNADLLSNGFIHFLHVGSPFAYLYAPLFYLYIKSISSKSDLKSWKNLLHFLPFLFYSTLLFITFYHHNAETKRQLISDNFGISNKHKIFYTTLLHVQVLYYILLSLKQINLFKGNVKQYYSSFNMVQYKWLVNFISVLTVIYLFDLFRFTSTFISIPVYQVAELLLFIGMVLMCYWVIYKAITTPIIVLPEKSIKSSKTISETTRQRYRNHLLNYMETNRPYLNPELSLAELSQAVSIPTRSLSEIINGEFKKTFYDFINFYRINEAINQLRQPDLNKTILEILYEVGYNSKSSFNTSFKKVTGLTPSQFRSQMIEKPPKDQY